MEELYIIIFKKESLRKAIIKDQLGDDRIFSTYKEAIDVVALILEEEPHLEGLLSIFVLNPELMGSF